MDIQARKKKELEVTIEGAGVYRVPLPTAMDPVELAGFIRARKDGDEALYLWAVEFFTHYMGEGMRAIDAEGFGELFKAWNTGGEPTAGESQASPS